MGVRVKVCMKISIKPFSPKFHDILIEVLHLHQNPNKLQTLARTAPRPHPPLGFEKKPLQHPLKIKQKVAEIKLHNYTDVVARSRRGFGKVDIMLKRGGVPSIALKGGAPWQPPL